MKIGKRILGTVMAGVLTAGLLAGCGGKPPVSSGGSQSSPADDGKLLVAAADLPVKGIFPVSDKYFNEATGDFDDAGFDKDSQAWDAAKTERERQAAEKNKGYTDFLLDLSRQMLSDPAVDNPAFSPLNIYLSLGMLAEVTDGETRAQILKTAHAGSLDDLYKSANALAQAVRRGDDAQTVDLGSSMWLSNKYPFNEDTVKKTAERYFASVFRGEFGDGRLDQALRDWLNEKTGGLLKDQVEGLKFDDPELAMVLAATIYLRTVWQDEFYEESTEDATFHGKASDTVTPFMHASKHKAVYEGEKFTAIYRDFVSGGGMYFVLPKEGVAPEELLEDEEAGRFLSGGAKSWENRKEALVHESIPKFDVTAEYDLKNILTAMGVADAFDQNKADFSPLEKDGASYFVSKAMHDARVTVDEHGVEAAAFTVYGVSATSMFIGDEVDFTLDRPFLYMIESDTNVPLFVGAVNEL